MVLTRACGWLALSSLIAAAPQTSTTTQSSVANASFAYVSDDGCVQNEVTVFANTTTVVSAALPKRSVSVIYSRYRYDNCEDSDLGTEVGTAARPAFSGDLNKASLNATIGGSTASGSAVTVSFVLVWEGKGGITRLAGRPQNPPRARSTRVIRSENLSRNAVVSGTIDGLNVSGGMVSASLHTTQNTISR